MIKLPNSLNAWGTSDFEWALKQEIEQMDKHLLPLQQGLAHSSHVTDRPIRAMVISVTEDSDHIGVKLGIFYTGVIAGCNCADDPTPVDEQNEYCVIRLAIDKTNAESTANLAAD